MAFNVEMAERVLGLIEANPEKHDQSQWARKSDCGTTMCFAGWVAHAEAGAVMNFDAGFMLRGGDTTASALLPDGKSVMISSLAQRLLGASDHQASELFYNSTDLDDLKHKIKEIANGNIV